MWLFFLGRSYAFDASSNNAIFSVPVRAVLRPLFTFKNTGVGIGYVSCIKLLMITTTGEFHPTNHQIENTIVLISVGYYIHRFYNYTTLAKKSQDYFPDPRS